MVTLELTDGKYRVDWDGRAIGTVRLYDNPYHLKNCYVELELAELDCKISAELFEKLRTIAARPLQAMTDSDDGAMVDFLTAGGFQRRRRCFEVEACAADYIGGASGTELYFTRPGEPEYAQCCWMMFDHYVQTHDAVNPWTAGFAEFCRALPAKAAYARQNGEIAALAFLEENEIAYVCGADEQCFGAFARSLVSYLLGQYETVLFESDDCDWAAMLLKKMFRNQNEASYDTYVKE